MWNSTRIAILQKTSPITLVGWASCLPKSLFVAEVFCRPYGIGTPLVTASGGFHALL
ncbi:hypothetical protein [Microseira wollei]|uniref:hypothetical protein n=1 Tax=Microseira wollei TaxID=467598 RepID=UPI001CFDBA2A|nr:hypothetical protein [Microseira wollei]